MIFTLIFLNNIINIKSIIINNVILRNIAEQTK